MENLELKRKLNRLLLVDILGYKSICSDTGDMFTKGGDIVTTWQFYGDTHFSGCFKPLESEKDAILLTEELLPKGYSFTIHSPLGEKHPDGWFCVVTDTKTAKSFHSTDPSLSLAICKAIFKAHNVEWIRD